MSFWKSVLEIFQPWPVRMEIRQGSRREEHIGEIDSIGDYSCQLKKPDGTLLVVAYDDILVLDEVRP